jgi:chemotaxis protein MotB
MRAKSDKKGNGKAAIVIRKEEVVEGGHHGGSWKVAYADFVTAMMAFFLLMWLLNATTEEQRKGLADYFSPTSVLSHNSSGTGQPFGGRTAFSDGAMVSDLGAAQAVPGQNPVVDNVEEDDSDSAAQPRPYRDDVKSNEQDRDDGRRAARPAPRTPPATANATAMRLVAPAAAQPGSIEPGTPPARAEAQRAPTKAELQAALERREKQAFDQAAQQIREAVGADPALAELARQLVIDVTPDGLRIQILDEDQQPMFPLGSAVPNDRARLLLQKVAPVLARLTQEISIAGHTDAAPFAGPGRTNWELSAERANATRRVLVDGGLDQARIRSVTGNADRDPLVPADPLAAANRRIAIVVLRSTHSQQAEVPPGTVAAATAAPAAAPVRPARGQPDPVRVPETP